jgi:hypothetical protein
MASGKYILPRQTSMPSGPGGLSSRTQTGKSQFRSTAAVGIAWTEEYIPLRADDAAVQKFLAWLRWAWREQQVFTITNLDLPGSGPAPNGAGGGTPLVKGANQTGSSIATDGWSAGITNIVRAGDVVKFSGLNLLYTIPDDASSNGSGEVTLPVDPPIFAGGSPADNAPITRTGCTVRAALASEPSWGSVEPGHLITGLTLAFIECP